MLTGGMIDLNEFLTALQKAKEDYGRSLFQKSNAMKLKAVLSDYAPGFEMKLKRRLLVNAVLELDAFSKLENLGDNSEITINQLASEMHVQQGITEELAHETIGHLADLAGVKKNTTYKRHTKSAFAEHNRESKVVTKYQNKEFDMHLLLATQGDAHAQYNLGLMHQCGRGVPKNWELAVTWYRKSAMQGNADAQYRLGRMYQDGRGVPQDYKQAAEWFRKSAEQGNSLAQCCLGCMYQYGLGVRKNDRQAITWYHKSAEQGHVGSKMCLGKLKQRI